MSRIRGKDTKPEMLVRKFLHGRGFRYKLHDPSLPGKPDLVLPKYKAVVNVHGCFWHGHEGCRYSKLPETRKEWWRQKIEKTMANDRKNMDTLKAAGWKVLTVWECELKADAEERLERLRKSILGGH